MPETSGDGPGDETKELLAEQSEELMEMFLEEKGDGAFWQKQAVRAFWEGRFIPAASGSALEGTGVGQLLELLYEYGAAGREKRTEEEKFSARVWKIRQEDRGERLTFLKILSGTLRVKDTVKTGEEEEKVNQIRFYSGEQYRTAEKAEAGSLCAVTGLRGTAAGQGLGMGAEDEGFEIHPVLQVKAVFREEEISSREMLRILRIIQEEDPTLQVVWQEETADIQIQMMGRIQLEVLQQIAEERFGVSLEFGKPEPVYAETIDSAVTGFGHFEPLRHYSEVALRIEPGERGSGIVFESRCHVDLLPIQYQKLIGTHVLERPIRGILTGSRVTDLKVTLLAGLHHIKHTEGGDFREAVYRALRQGLEKAENRLLEPYYRYEIRMPESCLGKVMADLGMLGVQMDPPAQSEGEAFLSGRGPAVFFMDYPVRLAAMTEGKGVVSLRPGGYDLCHNPEEVIAEKGYEKGADKEYPSSSVFCAKGTSFVVQWNEAESYMHTIKKGLVTEY